LLSNGAAIKQQHRVGKRFEERAVAVGHVVDQWFDGTGAQFIRSFAPTAKTPNAAGKSLWMRAMGWAGMRAGMAVARKSPTSFGVPKRVLEV
jgi:hypothetical protein